MKLFVCFCLAVAVVALAHESAVMDETTDLIQESALATSGAKTGAKVAEGVAVEAKAGAKAGLKSHTEAMVQIGTHSLSAAKVSMARARLKKITMKLGIRHPVFLGEAAGLQDFASENAKYVKDGYVKLRSILIKIDEFEGELVKEKDEAVAAREQMWLDCSKATATHNANTIAREAAQSAAKGLKDTNEAKINTLKSEIATELTNENGKAASIKLVLQDVATKYASYWQESEDRHAVRNVLMQALWLVCTGFASFRHTEYCTNIRVQPDFDEPATDPEEFECSGTGTNSDPFSCTQSSQKAELDKSTVFGETMQPVWEQQKLADAEAANAFDGDMDMEKGFVNNKAPWGVDPAGMESRGDNSGGEELGESNKDASTASDGTHLMTSQEMSARLTFLLESTDVPGRIQAPLTALIQAFDSNDAAVQGGLVEALVDMDTAEGVAQSNKDADYYKDMITNRQSLWNDVEEALTKKQAGVDKNKEIDDTVATMASNMDTEEGLHKDWIVTMANYATKMSQCEDTFIEKDALIEAMNEELVNIQRLNSLLRFLVVGDEAKCDGDCDCSNENQGTWTWRNRGEKATPADDTSCEDMTGQDIRCDYDGSYPFEGDGFGGDDSQAAGEGNAGSSLSQYAPSVVTATAARRDYAEGNAEARHNAKFCACEYGYFASDMQKEFDCKKMSCPGFGRIRYPGNGVSALQFEGMVPWIKISLTPTQITFPGDPDEVRNYGPYPGKTSFEPKAVCSGEPQKEHGVCQEDLDGKCVDCYYTSDDPSDTQFEEVAGVKSVKTSATHSYPFHGSRSKCEEWTVPKYVEANEVKWGFPDDPDICMRNGVPVRNFMGYSYPGKCECNAEAAGDKPDMFYGEACEQQMCWTNGFPYPAHSSAVCYGRGSCTNTGLVRPGGTPPPSPPQHASGSCVCNVYSYGPECQDRRCPGYNSATGTASMGTNGEECGVGLGKCDVTTGKCECATGTSCGIVGRDANCPGACIYNKCQSNCQGENTDGGNGEFGKCDRYSGYCMCSPDKVLNGPDCEYPIRLENKKMMWGDSFDRWGWSICAQGYLMYGIQADKQGTKDALFNIQAGLCGKPGENNMLIDRAVEAHRCYHENWWKKFDTRGGKFCRRNYFLAGLFRSHCNSLYCIEMAKCCNVKRSIWTDCAWTNKAGWNDRADGTMEVERRNTHDDAFAVGFFRTAQHTLTGLTYIRQCVPIWWGQIVSYKTRFD